MTAQEQAILAAFPGDDHPHRTIRVALLQVLHAGQWAELDLPLIASWIQRTIDDPPWSIWFGPDDALQLASNLDRLAWQLRRASAALNAAQPQWNELTSAEASDDVGIRDNRETEQAGDEVPF